MVSLSEKTQVEYELRKTITGDIKFDSYSRMLYSTDASIYQMEPIGVVLPRNTDDVIATMQICSDSKTIFLPRGGGTSLAGQTVNHGVVVDFTKYMNRILSINPEERWAIVEPGITIDALNAGLKPYGLYYTPDPTTKSRATIGGSLGNNSCGAHSVVYGKTSDQVLELDVILSNAEHVHFNTIEENALQSILSSKPDSLEKRIYTETLRLASEHREEIDRRYPRIQRRVSGYNLDFLRDNKPVNLSNMIVGSEGTLGTITAAKVKLEPIPTNIGLAIVHFKDLFESMEATVMILDHGPSAVELVDKMILDRSKSSLGLSRQTTFIEGDPEAILLVEFFGENMKEVESKIDNMNQALQKRNLSYACSKALRPEEQRSAWAIRSAGLGLLMSVKGDSKPLPFVEDTAVSPERLPEYVRRFDSIVKSHNTYAGYYGHASVGCLHIRPMINIKTQSGLRDLVSISDQISDLVLEFNGSMSGEHGDGIVRGVWTEKMLGSTLYQAFKDLKNSFDPDNILNPGKIINTPPMTENLRLGPDQTVNEPTTVFDFSKDQGFTRAIEMCNGVGECRKYMSGTMCPSYMATLDEEHSTRGRANALRSVLSGKIPSATFASKGLFDVMDLCLECKACKAECPSQVDMAKLKYEFLNIYYKENGYPLRARIFANIGDLSKIGSALAPVSNWLSNLGITRWILDKYLNIDKRRPLPKFVNKSFQKIFESNLGPGETTTRGKVVLFNDTFMNYNYPNVGKAAVKIIEEAGFEVNLVDRKCCGRPMISKGMLDAAKENARYNVDLLYPYIEDGAYIVGCEPSCLLSFRDEYPELLQDEKSKKVSEKSFLLEEFLDMLNKENSLDLDFQETEQTVLFHGHCHEKALVGNGPALSILNMVPGLTVREIDSGCCGMAGAFGYEKEHYDISMTIGSQRLFPAVNEVGPGTKIVVTGTSCRQQIQHGTNRETTHIAELLASLLA
ncbi:MAG: anaerobic glycerol-3-phosphate dehydrogenase subunit C [SAR202 cluster bacterium]|nr:anaerobic glycerol-3-phosphate dehydrogenase subunit C [SAR202 cluster bacterium]|tara:strand:+ start:5361 stop:8252 length:2892 start_codon:yes stop_codon:yes gene_type:complete